MREWAFTIGSFTVPKEAEVGGGVVLCGHGLMELGMSYVAVTAMKLETD